MKLRISTLLLLFLVANCLVAEIAPTNQLVEDQILNGYVLGMPTNDISAAARFFAVPQSKVAVCLLCSRRTNSFQLWIAPPQFQRVKYHLWDSSGKTVPYLPGYHPPHKIFRSIDEVPKNVHNVHEGLMWAPFSMPYDQVSLTNIFQIEHDGDYKLIAEAQIMKVNRNSTLDLVKFPPVSLTIQISGEHRDFKNGNNANNGQ